MEYDSAVNGVFLLYKDDKYTGDESKHIGSHGKEYIEYVTEQLREVEKRGGTKADVVEEINEIRKSLLNGSLPLN
ncbi:AHH domain-containing protein [Mechercharimyces sp. CAU 1602]|nr:AHH domain-containing protein [Mechercharimyces sp. CAU 1602]MCS1350379.1 AHH domain-containing protein [Mechercharimyces sp. CAU 1602]